MLGCHHSVAHKLEHKMGYFELLGFDFMLDSTHHVSSLQVIVITHFTVIICVNVPLLVMTKGRSIKVEFT